MRRTRAILLFERLWPAIVLAASIAGVFLTVSWLGLWVSIPGWSRPFGLLPFVAGLGYAAVLAWRGAIASRSEVLSRLDRDSGLPHRPISAGMDRLADPQADPFTQALWALHRRRSAEAAAAVRLRAPSPRVVDRDRYAVRALGLLAAVAACFAAGVDKDGRLAAAFDWRGSPAAASAGFRLDAWIDPPAYTGRAPVLLTAPNALASGPAAPATDGVAHPSSALDVPVGSTVVVRSVGDGAVRVTGTGDLRSADLKPDPEGGPGAKSGIAESRFKVAGDGAVTVERDGSRLAQFTLRAVPDRAPTIALLGTPTNNLRGSLTLSYKIDDDYGVVGAEATFAKPVLQGKPLAGRSLVDPPKLALGLPSGARGLGQARTTGDLSAHPWAGAEVTAVLTARDEGGNVGASAPVTLTLPARPFSKPLARALVEQRRNLVLDPDHRERVDLSLGALLLYPELTDTPPSVFLGLNAARSRLSAAKTDKDLLDVADLLWSIALSIEDGDLSQTERDLRALQRELRDAMARNAPPEEIRRLTEALKQQLDKLLSEMAQGGGKDRAKPAPGGKMRTVTPQDLQKLLDRLERSARDGDMAAAQALLDQLQGILENLQAARPDAGQEGDAQRSAGALDKMMRDQQALRDKTFRRGNQQRRQQQFQDDESLGDGSGEDGERGDQPQAGGEQKDGAEANADLGAQQRALREQLDALQRRMQGSGLEAEKGFGDAERAMKDAEAALGRGASGSDQAVEAQGRALQGLQKGARGLQRQLAQRGEDGQGASGQEGIGREDGVGDQTGTDPLGRERNGGIDARRGLDADGGLAERARQVLEELRRRLGDRLRPQDEQDYLERLLKRY